MLEWAYGYRTGDVSRRRAPSAGALYPCELLTIEHGTAGWRCFLYDFRRQQRIWMPAVDASAAALILRLSHHQAAVIVAAALWRSVQRYGARAYRYCALDAGHIMGNLNRVASQAIGPPRWHAPPEPEVSALLGLPHSVAALASGVFDLTGLDLPSLPAAASAGQGQEGASGNIDDSRADRAPEETPLVSPQLLRVQRFHGRTQACGAAMVPQPSAASTKDLFTVLEMRRSAKDFLAATPDEFPSQSLAAVTEYLRDGAPGAGQILSLAAHAARPPAGTLSQTDLCRLCVHQDLVSRAGAAVLFTCPSPGQPGESFDHGGFLRACVYAGMASAELYRLAVDLRLGSTMIGGFLDSAMLPVCERGRYPLAVQVFGQPATGARRKVDAADMVAAGA